MQYDLFCKSYLDEITNLSATHLRQIVFAQHKRELYREDYRLNTNALRLVVQEVTQPSSTKQAFLKKLTPSTLNQLRRSTNPAQLNPINLNLELWVQHWARCRKILNKHPQLFESLFKNHTINLDKSIEMQVKDLLKAHSIWLFKLSLGNFQLINAEEKKPSSPLSAPQIPIWLCESGEFYNLPNVKKTSDIQISEEVSYVGIPHSVFSLQDNIRNIVKFRILSQSIFSGLTYLLIGRFIENQPILI